MATEGTQESRQLWFVAESIPVISLRVITAPRHGRLFG